MTSDPDRSPTMGSPHRTRGAQDRRRLHFDLEVVDDEIVLHGDLDGADTPRLADLLTCVGEQRPGPVVVDASDVGVFGAAAVRVLHVFSENAAQSGRVAVCNPSPTVRRVLEIVGRTDLLLEHDDYPATFDSSRPGLRDSSPGQGGHADHRAPDGD